MIKEKKRNVEEKRNNEDIRFSFKDIIAITIAVYQILAPKIIAIIIAIILVSFILKIYMS